jgi:hypothetical protein
MRAERPRRHVLGLVALAPWAALVVGPPPRPARAAVPTDVHTRWSGRPDQPLPSHGDEGLPLRVVAVGHPPPVIAGGGLAGNLPESASATYVEQDLPAKIVRIGAEFGFGPGSARGALGLIAWVPGQPLTGHGHIAITPEGWVAATVRDGALTEYASGEFRVPLVTDGRPYRAEVRFDGATAALTLPDGTSARGDHPDVARLDGTVACWEFYREDADGAPVVLYRTWAA